ncbi:hypothetical protein HDU96_003123 [Phlyctochytrium bullatum]|nr:hypothetical protein HDU96_003123 [Phlyctochytrium bullatum]
MEVESSAGEAASPAKRDSLPPADSEASISEEPAVQGRDITAVPESKPVPMSGAESSNGENTYDVKTSDAPTSNGGHEQTELDKVQLKYCSKILKTSKRLKDAPPFLQPVDPVKLNIPTYFDVIKHPMDISTIQNKLDNNLYPNYAAFKKDLDLMFDNCYLFNGKESFVGKMGSNLQKYFTDKLQSLPTTVPSASAPVKKLKIQPEVSRPKRETHVPARDLPQQSISKKGGPKKITPELKIAAGIIKEIMKPKYLNINFPFLEPVDHVKLQIPTYPLIVKNPMDLGTIQKRLDAGHYSSVSEVEADVRLMFSNCRLFNQPGTDVYEMGRKLENLFDAKWKDLKDRATPTPLPAPKTKSSSAPTRTEDSSSSSEDESVNMNVLLQENFLKMIQQLTKRSQKKEKKKEKEKSRSSAKSHTSIGSSKSKPKQKETSPKASHKLAKPKKSSASGKRKASSDEDSVKEVTYEQKKELSEKIEDLSPDQLETVYKIIQSGLPNLETQTAGQQEIELDIEALDKVTVYKLYKFVKSSTKKPPAKRLKTGAAKKTETKPTSTKAKDKAEGTTMDEENVELQDVQSAKTVKEPETGGKPTAAESASDAVSEQPAPKSHVVEPTKEHRKEFLSTTKSTVGQSKKTGSRPAAPKRRETIDIFSYVDEYEEKKKEEVALLFKELEKQQKRAQSASAVPPENPKEDSLEKDLIGAVSKPDYEEPTQEDEEYGDYALVAKATSANWLELHSAGAQILEFEDDLTTQVGKSDEELQAELTSERDSLVMDLGRELGIAQALASTAEVELQEKLTKAGIEIDVLLKELEHNNEVSGRLKTKAGQQQVKIELLEDQAEIKDADRVEMTSDMSRQYKSMQAEMMARINVLEMQNAEYKQKLAAAQSAAQEAAKEFTRIIAQKDEIIEEQNVKMSYMSTEFETMLNV